jgi:hypothetical protein
MNMISNECTLIRQLILKSQLDELTGEETTRLNTHIKSCPQCRSLRSNLSLMAKSLAVNVSDPPLPKPEIQLLLQQQVLEIKSVRNKSDYSIGEIFINFLKRPIPLYQVAVVFIPIFCLAVYILITLTKSDTESVTAIKSQYSHDKSYNQYINYYPAQSVLPMRVGINAAEDTSFQSILFSAL